MGTPKKSVQLKVFVDKKKNKVMFAEADEDFVDILFSLFTLPLGTIARFSTRHALMNMKVGSLTSLYESVVNLNENHFFHVSYKDLLVNPRNASASLCQKLKVNLDETSDLLLGIRMPVCTKTSTGRGDLVIVKSMANFIITDDLNVVPVMFDTSILLLLKSLGVEDITLLEEITKSFGMKEFLVLLNWSLLTNDPLTNLVFGTGGGMTCSSSTTNSTLTNSPLISSSSGHTHTLKLLVQKSNKKLLCAQVENPFVKLLFSFLTIPLGAFIRLTKDDSSALGITNLYNSISALGDGKYLKSEDVKTRLLCPKVAADYFGAIDFIPIHEENKRPVHFLKERTTFVVSNDLNVTACPSLASISKCNTLGVPVGDMEILEASIGKHEALLLLKTSLTSTSALSDFFNAFRSN